ncbi:hypothetical protein [Allostreptomyces psammosilenae]|uniref:Uncharacterized protein n=1 Tax=Allostreptomyces psammosilenae TaxID=1892865 RepID=A0A852ZY15_9ACTN|nr:hypothetical protein [Allostreptomyces psammosilenae]NYI07069.1 hypothetical protein [Allostreptomyces psammosilenae]
MKLNILGRLTLDFKGGFTLGVQTADTDRTTMKFKELRMEADTSPSTPGSGTLISLASADMADTPLSTLNSSRELRLHTTLILKVTDKETGETLLRLSTAPGKYATLKADNVQTFPMVNQLLTLQEPVHLFEVSSDGTVQTDQSVGALEGFDVIANQIT